MSQDQTMPPDALVDEDDPDVICRDSPALCDRDPPLEHRRHRRLEAKGPLIGVKSNSSKALRGQVEDVSAEGLCLQLEGRHGLIPGQSVNVRIDDDDWVMSLVAHVEGSHVGLWFGEPAPPEARVLVERLAQRMR